MRVSLNLAQYYSNVDLQKIGKEKLLEKIGTQLGAIEEVEDWGPRFDGILVARVVSCVSHPNADKLHVCTIDDGKKAKNVKRDSSGLIQVVCGAPNVKAGQIVAWLPPGSIVPATIGKEPLVLEAREIRGVVSNGMLASLNELGIGDDHSGILEIDPREVGIDLAKPGTEFKKLYGLDDIVVDIENKMFTHRPDCFGILGVARELAGIQGKSFKSPDWYLKQTEGKFAGSELKLHVNNPVHKLVTRFMAQVVENIQIGPSPVWLQAVLARAAIKPINNIVDLSNYYMYLTAQPTHAFDYDKIKALSGSVPTLGPRKAIPGEELTLLGGKKIKLDTEDIVIATDKQAVALAGIMGGADTEVDENTRTIIIECATFDMYSVRRSSMRHGLFTDAVTRFNKGQSPLQNDRVLAKMASDLKIQGANPTKLIFDIKQANLDKPKSVRVSPQFINERLGLSLSMAQITNMLENVEFKIMKAGSKQLAVVPPFWRTDISIPEDVVEEVGRLYGFDHLPLELPKHDLTPEPPDEELMLKNQIRDSLSRAGANEVLSYSFVHGDLFEKVGQDTAQAFQLNKSISPDLQYYRMSLTPSLLEKVHPNIKSGHDKFALFELGKTHSNTQIDESGLPREFNRVALVFAAREPLVGAAYYQALKYVRALTSLPIVPFDEELLSGHKILHQLAKPYNPKRSGLLWNGKMAVGIVGEFSPNTKRSLKLPEYSSGFEIFLSSVAGEVKNTYVPLPRFPKVEQDICLRVRADLPFSDLEGLVSETLLEHDNEFRIETKLLDIYQREDDKEHKQITFRMSIASYERTLTDKEAGKILDTVEVAAHQKFDAMRI